jgi:hypothetical protein
VFGGLIENQLAIPAVPTLASTAPPALRLSRAQPGAGDRLRLRTAGYSSRPRICGFQQDGRSEKRRSRPGTRARTTLCPSANSQRRGRLDGAALSGFTAATGTTRNDTNIHVDPGRETEHLYQLNQGSKVAILKRATAEKTVPGPAAKPASANKNESPKPVTPAMEDWWLIRDPDGRVGWVLARMVDLDVPLEIAQYAEGQRLVAFFVLDQVADGDKKVPQYLVALSEPKDGLPFDYNQVRVFTWNVKHHRYETAYREHNLNGVLPVTVSQENFDKEGMLPIFVLQVKDDNSKISARKYKMNSPIVRRVLAPGEAKEPSAPRKKTRHH